MLAAKVKRGAELLRVCRGRITAAKVEVTQIVAELDPGAADDAELRSPPSRLVLRCPSHDPVRRSPCLPSLLTVAEQVEERLDAVPHRARRPAGRS